MLVLALLRMAARSFHRGKILKHTVQPRGLQQAAGVRAAMPTVGLLNSAPSTLSASEVSSLLERIRSTDYIAEASSGECAPHESPLWDAVLPLQDALQKIVQEATQDGTQGASESEGIAPAQIEAAAVRFVRAISTRDGASSAETEQAFAPRDGVPDADRRWSAAALVVADARSKRDGTLLIAELDSSAGGQGKTVKDSMRIAPGSVIEVAVNLDVANMSLAEYKNMAGGADVFDSGQ